MPVLLINYSIIFYSVLKNGARDLRMMNSKISRDTVQGAGTDYINEAMISEEARYDMGQTIGMPTDRFSDGQHISQLQKLPKGPDGHRHYKIQGSKAMQQKYLRNGGNV